MTSTRPLRSAWKKSRRGLALLLVLSACTSAATISGPEADAPTREVDAATDGNLDVLPVRGGPPEVTTGDVPHIQLDSVRDLDLTLELTRRAYSLPGVENRASVVTLPGAQSLWLGPEVEVVRPDVLVAGREFGHVHPDSSMHLWLPPDRAVEVAENGWGELHPWVERDGFWGGVVIVWAPESPEDVAVSFRLIVDAFNFVTGQNLDAVDFE